jgi:hypothetical protein
VRKLATLAFFGALGGTLLAGHAWAQNARYPRPLVVPAVKLSDRVKALVPKPPTAPPLMDASMALSIEGIAKPPRNEQEQILVELIAHTADSEVDEKSDYYFRLAELYASQQRFWLIKAA